MAIPTLPVSLDSELREYAQKTGSKLIVSSVLFDDHIVEFLPFITDLSQTFNSTWNTENVFGRNDPIGIFQGTTRVISIGFDLIAGSLAEAQLNLQKLDYLASFMYPSYKENPQTAFNAGGANQQIPKSTTHMYGAPLIRVKFANLVNNSISGGNDGLLGWSNTLSINPDFNHGTFIKKTGNPVHFPKLIQVSFDLNVLHEATPGYSADGVFSAGKEYFFGTPTEAGRAQQEAQQAAEDELNNQIAREIEEERTGESIDEENDPFGESVIDENGNQISSQSVL